MISLLEIGGLELSVGRSAPDDLFEPFLDAAVELHLLQELLLLGNGPLLLESLVVGGAGGVGGALLALGVAEGVLEADAVLGGHEVLSEDHAEGVALDPGPLGHAIDVARLSAGVRTCSWLTIWSATSQA